MKIEIAGKTDVGRVREQNEDGFLIVPEQNLAVVCDGMGGHRAGEVASQGAIQCLKLLITPAYQEQLTGLFLSIEQTLPTVVRQLVAAVRVTNRRLFNTASADLRLRGMGTTFVGALFEQGGCAICHVGDSRAYLIRNGVIHRLTTDHSWLAELIESGELTHADEHTFAERNVITRSLGTRPVVKLDLRWDPVEEGDLVLLCSDGLSGFLSDQDILKIITSRKNDLRAVVKQLIKKANEAGGEDNITVALARVISVDVAEEFKRFQGTVPEETEGELAVADRIIQTVFQGLPLKRLEEMTDAIPVPKKKKFGLFSW